MCVRKGVGGNAAAGPGDENDVYRDVSYQARIYMYRLTATAGMVKGANWPIGSRPLVIGRESNCDVRIPDPVVSRHHCEIVLDEDVIRVRDLGSLNPTMVNGRPITDGTLQAGDEVRIGRVVFHVTFDNGDSTQSDAQLLSTDTLAEQDSVYLASRPSGGGIEVQPQTDEDLNQLFLLSRSLSRMSSEADLVRAVGDAIMARFEPDHAWILLLRETGEELLEFGPQRSSPGGKAVPPPHEWMVSTLAVRNGLLTPKRITIGNKQLLRCMMAAPLLFGEHPIGVLALQRDQADRAYQLNDLHFFVALAHIVAPFFKALERIQGLEAENQRLRDAGVKLTRLIGGSKAMARVQRMLKIVAPTPQPVLILGPTGTGKELVARLIHDLSERAREPLVTVNCAAIPHDLFESEFFGHEKGAFTGAESRKVGLLEQSHRGTLFLDEVGDLSLEHQARILRAVETGRFRRVGGEEEIGADFRVIAATNKELLAEIQKGRFREDLYHRLKAVEIRIPPLSQRRCDIPELARHFLEAAGTKNNTSARRLSPQAIEYLTSLPWPGNVRELKNMIETANTFSQGEVIDLDALRVLATAHDSGDVPLPLSEIERLHIIKALEYTDGNLAETARLLGIARNTLYSRLTQYGLSG